MSQNAYLPLFRKYRPQSFKDVIGQEFTVRALENAIKLNKIANAYLFCGPRGTGKTSSARIFAKSLNCAEGPTVDPCQKCQSCLDVTNASGLDVIEIDAATNRGIDDAKELISKVHYAPMNGKYKIFIIDEVHMLSKEAFNALLKTFEEPPSNVIFILATTEPHKVLETIVSRCQRFDFRRITIDDIVKRLREISDIEKINITDEALYSIAKNVSGGMRDSLALLDQASILGIEKQITKEVIEELIGKLTFDTLYDLLCAILNGQIEEAVNRVDKIYEKGSEPRNFIENFIEFLRNIVLVLNSKDVQGVSNLTLIDPNHVNKIRDNQIFNKDKIVLILDKIIEFYKEIKISTNPYLWAELAIIQSCSLGIISLKENTVQNGANNISAGGNSIHLVQNIAPIAINTTSAVTNTASAAPKAMAQPSFETPAQNPDFQPQKIQKEPESQNKPEVQNAVREEKMPDTTLEQDVQKTNEVQSSAQTSAPAEIWASILSKISSVPAKFFFSGVGKLINIQDGHITLGFVNQNVITQAKSDNKYNPLLKAVNEVLGEGGSVEFITITNDTKIIDTKFNVKIAKNETPERPINNNFQKPNSPVDTPKDVKIDKPKTDDNTDTDEASDTTVEYSKVTKNMLETYGGRVVE